MKLRDRDLVGTNPLTDLAVVTILEPLGGNGFLPAAKRSASGPASLGPGKRPVALKTGQKAVQMEHLMQLSIFGFILIFTAESAESTELNKCEKRNST